MLPLAGFSVHPRMGVGEGRLAMLKDAKAVGI